MEKIAITENILSQSWKRGGSTLITPSRIFPHLFACSNQYNLKTLWSNLTCLGKKSIRKDLNMVYFSLMIMTGGQSSSLNSHIFGLLHQSSPWPSEVGTVRNRVAKQNVSIKTSFTLGLSFIISSQPLEEQLPGVRSQRVLFCISKYWCAALVGGVSLFLWCSQQRKVWWPWRVHTWVCEGLKSSRSSPSFPSYCGSHSQTKVVKR